MFSGCAIRSERWLGRAVEDDEEVLIRVALGEFLQEHLQASVVHA